MLVSAPTIKGTEVFMSATTLVSPEPEEVPKQRKDAVHVLPRNESGGSQSTLPVSPDSELQNLNEGQLKAQIKSAWKKHERLAKKDMAPLLYWLRVKLRAPGSRNDIHDKDRGFGAWVEDNLDISRATADRWAEQHALENGLKEPTSPHVRRGCKDPDFYKRKLAKRSKGVTLWVKEPLRDQYWHALDAIKKHFNITDNGEAVVKGLCYAAKTIALPNRTSARHASAVGRRKR
jgi:hypothetical protein